MEWVAPLHILHYNAAWLTILLCLKLGPCGRLVLIELIYHLVTSYVNERHPCFTNTCVHVVYSWPL